MVCEGAEAGQRVRRFQKTQKVSVQAVKMKIVVWLFVEVGGSVIDGRD